MPTTLENREDMKQHLVKCFADSEMAATLRSNFAYMLKVMGVNEADANPFVEKLAAILTDQSRDVGTTEAEAFKLVEETKFETTHGFISVAEAVDLTLLERAENIGKGTAQYLQSFVPDFSEVADMFDFGTGSGRPATKVAEILRSMGWHGIMYGGDIKDYRTPDVKGKGLVQYCPISSKSEVQIHPESVELATIMHVLHHGNAGDILRELNRIVKKNLYILEVVPTGSSAEEVQRDSDRMRAVDIFFCRTLHSPTAADIPVPGNFKTREGWVEAVQSAGFRVVKHEDRVVQNAMFPNFQQHAYWLEKIASESRDEAPLAAKA